MKYFTMDCLHGNYSPDLNAAYRRRFSEIRGKLPADLIWLQEYSRLHDARVLGIHFTSAISQLDLRLRGIADLTSDTIQDRIFELGYRDVRSIVSLVHPKGVYAPLGGYGDVAYDEVDVTNGEDIEHRLLFTTGIEIQIVFKNFELEWQDIDEGEIHEDNSLD